MKCDQCQALMINGTYCHELGCPNMNARWDVEEQEWVKQWTCDECGNKVDVGEQCCVDEDGFDWRDSEDPESVEWEEDDEN